MERGDPLQLPEHHKTASDPSSDIEVTADQHHENLTSPGDRSKQLADSPAHSSDKQPSVKKQYGAGTCSPTADLPAMQSIAAFPTTNNPASEHSLKAMLLSLQADLHRELKISINQLQDKVDSVEECTDHIEMHLSEATNAHNTIVNIQDEQANVIRTLHLKVTDLEDRLRRNNKIGGP